MELERHRHSSSGNKADRTRTNRSVNERTRRYGNEKMDLRQRKEHRHQHSAGTGCKAGFWRDDGKKRSFKHLCLEKGLGVDCRRQKDQRGGIRKRSSGKVQRIWRSLLDNRRRFGSKGRQGSLSRSLPRQERLKALLENQGNVRRQKVRSPDERDAVHPERPMACRSGRQDKPYRLGRGDSGRDIGSRRHIRSCRSLENCFKHDVWRDSRPWQQRKRGLQVQRGQDGFHQVQRRSKAVLASEKRHACQRSKKDAVQHWRCRQGRTEDKGLPLRAGSRNAGNSRHCKRNASMVFTRKQRSGSGKEPVRFQRGSGQRQD